MKTSTIILASYLFSIAYSHSQVRFAQEKTATEIEKQFLKITGQIQKGDIEQFEISKDTISLSDTSMFRNCAICRKDSTDPPDFLPVDSQATTIELLPPDYPAEARKANIQDDLWFKLLIDQNGTVKKVVLLKGHSKLLAKASMISAMHSKWKPAYMNGKPITYWASIPFRFHLNAPFMLQNK